MPISADTSTRRWIAACLGDRAEYVEHSRESVLGHNFRVARHSSGVRQYIWGASLNTSANSLEMKKWKNRHIVIQLAEHPLDSPMPPIDADPSNMATQTRVTASHALSLANC